MGEHIAKSRSRSTSRTDSAPTPLFCGTPDTLAMVDLQDDSLLPPHFDADSIPNRVKKYWVRRKSLFSKYDEGVRMDVEGWFSVTPESIAKHQAERCRCDLIIDAFAGVGGNAIQFAMTCEQVIAIEMDPVRLACAKRNAQVYGVAHRIEFIQADALEYLERLAASPTSPRPDVIFLSPPWGSPEYLTAGDEYQLRMMPIDWNRLETACRALTPHLAMYLPRTMCAEDIQQLAISAPLEIEEAFTGKGLLALTLYTGDLTSLDSMYTRARV